METVARMAVARGAGIEGFRGTELQPGKMNAWSRMAVMVAITTM